MVRWKLPSQSPTDIWSVSCCRAVVVKKRGDQFYQAQGHYINSGSPSRSRPILYSHGLNLHEYLFPSYHRHRYCIRHWKCKELKGARLQMPRYVWSAKRHRWTFELGHSRQIMQKQPELSSRGDSMKHSSIISKQLNSSSTSVALLSRQRRTRRNGSPMHRKP